MPAICRKRAFSVVMEFKYSSARATSALSLSDSGAARLGAACADRRGRAPASAMPETASSKRRRDRDMKGLSTLGRLDFYPAIMAKL